MKAKIQIATPYLVVFTAASLGAVAFFGRQPFLVDGIWQGWGDSVWFQAVAMVASDSGPFGLTDRLGWPDSYSLWSHPQPGFLILSLFFALGGVLGLSSSIVLAWSMVIVSGLNAASTLFFLRSISKSQQVLISSASISVGLSLSPFVLLKLEHLNVAAFFLIPIFLGAVFRLRGIHKLRTAAFLVIGLAMVSFTAPLWWLVVAIYLGLGLSFLNLISRNFLALKQIIPILAALAIGFIGQFAIHISAPTSNTWTRGPWDSNIYGGRMVDILLSSPLLNNLIGVWDPIRPGASVELSQVGLLGLGLSLTGEWLWAHLCMPW